MKAQEIINEVEKETKRKNELMERFYPNFPYSEFNNNNYNKKLKGGHNKK